MHYFSLFLLTFIFSFEVDGKEKVLEVTSL